MTAVKERVIHDGAQVRQIRVTPVKRASRSYRLTPAAPPLNMQAGSLPREKTRVTPPAAAAPESQATAAHEHLQTIYLDDRVVLLPRDPQWLYCYWDFSDGTMNALSDSMARFGGELVLRVHDVTGQPFDGSNSNQSVDVVLPRQAQGNWYFQAFGEDREHLVEIGINTSDNRFQAVVRSNIVRTPRSAAAPPQDDTREEMLVDFAHERAALDARQEPDLEGSSHPSSPLKPIGPHAPAPAQGGPEAPTSPLAGWAPSSPLGLQGPMPTLLPPEAKDRDFWLIVDAELIVYGATVPGSHLKIQGQPLPLRPDGTFTVRFALPDGRQVIPVEATSADGVDRREITPIVERWTESDEDEG